MKVHPYNCCPKCGSDDLLILAERVHHLDGALADDASEQIGNGGILVCANGCGPFYRMTGLGSCAENHHARIEATLDRAAGVLT